MNNTNPITSFAIDGYSISATFSEEKNANALGQVQQILLSAFTNNISKSTSGDILAFPEGKRDNIGRESTHAP